MIKIHVRKGHPLEFAGRPSDLLSPGENPATVGVLPEQIPHINPRLNVDVGDRVKIGSVLFSDKRRDDLRFLSPGGGEIAAVHFGPRRVVKEIVIKLAEVEEAEHFEKLTEAGLAGIDAGDLLKRMAQGGVLPFLRVLPYRDIVLPGTTPPRIFVSLTRLDPFHPDPLVYLQGQVDLFNFGLKALKRITPQIIVYAGAEHRRLQEKMGNIVTHSLDGDYPAADPGVVLYQTRTCPEDNASWFVNGQDLLLVADFLKNGLYPTRRIVTVGGSAVSKGQHYHTRLGAPLQSIIDSDTGIDGEDRFVAGGLFNGYTLDPGQHLGMYETTVTVVPEGNKKLFLGFVRPGFKRASRSRTFLSILNPNPLSVDCHMYGEERACVNCSSCALACPVDILPQYTYKSILADEIEEALAHGLLDCVECGVCSYVCPSKIELNETFKAARKGFYKEQSGS
jgi:Na+-transporting NADH:ubiquinone oxidoreductase subunit A